MITTHQLPEVTFAVLAEGLGDTSVVRQLREAQYSKHLMLIHAVAEAADDADPTSPAVTAFRSAYRLLTDIKAVNPRAIDWLLGLPHIGGWTHDCLIHMDQGSPVDFAYLAYAAAAAGLHAGMQFELQVPVRDRKVLLPGLGWLDVDSDRSWVQICSDGRCLTIDVGIEVPCAALIPDDGSGQPIPHWHGTPLVRAEADGMEWHVLLETGDRYLDRYTLPMSAAMTADEVVGWRLRLQSAWRLLVRHHNWTAGPISEGVGVIVPLTPVRDTDLVSATTPAAFGAIATTRPPDPVIMAETLVHEFQHLKLCGLMDMVPLIEPGGEKVYAPWRQDPRPAGGLLQGVYAHLGIARFWNSQRRVETDPDDMLRAQVMYERWRSTVELATGTLLDSGCLTPIGVWFVDQVRERGQSLESAAVPEPAQEIAREVALDHWLTWQFRHTAIDFAAMTSLAASYRRGEPFRNQMLPQTCIEEDIREIGSNIRGQLLNLRYLDPRRLRELGTAMPELNEADRYLVGGDPEAAVTAYRDEISAAAGPIPEAWVGLTLAIHRLPRTPLQQVFATKLPLMFDMHSWLIGQGVESDPLQLASWFS